MLDHDDPPRVEATLEKLIAKRFELNVPVFARTAAAWTTLITTCRFPTETETELRKLHVLVFKRPPSADAADLLPARARDGEKVARWGNDLAIHFTNGVGTSRLLPAIIDRLIGTPATARTWNTAVKLEEMAAG